MEFTFPSDRMPLNSIVAFLQDQPRDKKWTVIKDHKNHYLVEGVVQLQKQETLVVTGITTVVISKFKY